ncbi:Gryzun, putative trafficking through golgi-domain-containing protein [Podospora didyma]|uniref:Gryzun, putative trafficking through golgi-domain-containing protein n=1 Tax=Podospora didyma TaxID=330526 RepID=A0AAE0NHD9_9PEZI|nr:Gryzun, putative trafficking through golgi-domain-containing protein [Podospora didyma]
MDEYPTGSLDQNIPLLLTLGTSARSTYDPKLSPALKDQAILIRSELPALDTVQAHALLSYVENRDASFLPANGRDGARRYRFRVKTAERSFLLPPRRARLPDGIEASPLPAVLHSPYSPLSPVSPLYPDGLMDTQWILKHQDFIPSVLLCFYDLVSEPSLATLCDNKIKTDVNNLRGLLSQSGYRTRLAVVLLSDQALPSVDGVQERLENIRRVCGLDPKALFLVPPNESQEELERMAENMLTTLYGVAVEYFRDLGRHSRKKRGRNMAPQPTVPPTSGTSQTLSLAGWNVRYDFKSAMFAEYRLEMDNALRSFEQAYENLLGVELFETIPSWSPRWNDARFLADVIAVRCLRCLLWNGQHSAAARRWQAHRDRVAEFVDRRGRGTNNYGWEAWEARWATVMANLIEKAEISDFAPSTLRIYLQPEKNVMGERLQPWELLHHPGYWYHLAAKHLCARRDLAHAMSEDDRMPPSFSPASHVASTAFTYDTYMCPQPHEEYPINSVQGVDHSHKIIECLMRARSEFLKRQQLRFAAELSLECARELTLAKSWRNVVELLRSLWQDLSFRAEGWLTIAEDLSWALRSAATVVGDASLVIAIDWELLSRSFTRRTNWHYDITRSLEGMAPQPRPKVCIKDGQLLPFVATSFSFGDEEGKAGQSTLGQLVIKSNAHQGSAPITLSNIEVKLGGSVSRIVLKHEAASKTTQHKHGAVKLSAVPLLDGAEGAEKAEPGHPDKADRKVTLHGAADLTLLPGQTLVFVMEIPLREPGETRAVSLTLGVESDAFELEHSLNFGEGSGVANIWYISASATKRIARASPNSVRVLPRPPKMKIKNPSWREQYYTDEPIELEFDLINEEVVEAIAKLDVDLFGEDTPAFSAEIDGHDVDESSSTSIVENDESRLQGVSLGSIESSHSLTVRLRLPPIQRSSRYDLTLRVAYHLSTDIGTPIMQTAVFQLNIVNPFEANYELLPRVHPDPWPSLFDYEGVADVSGDNDGAVASSHLTHKGLSQAWYLITRYASFASEDLRVMDVDIRLQTARTVRCFASKRDTAPGSPPEDAGGGGRVMLPNTIVEAGFDIIAQKSTLDDRSPATLDVSLVIKWSRCPNPSSASRNSPPINTTILLVPRFSLFGTEPRVLATVSYGLPTPVAVKVSPSPVPPSLLPRQPQLIILHVVIENASNHFLTFGLAMEPSEDFAFSGPKQTTLHLLPVSRRSVTYRLLPLGNKALPPSTPTTNVFGGAVLSNWIKPSLVVRDKYFQKVLRVIPAADGMKLDKDGGVLLWVPPDVEEDPEEEDESSSEEE